MQKVEPDKLEPGTWTVAVYEDTEARIVYQCDCGKVNALPLDRRHSETGIMLDATGTPEAITCERKTCDVNEQLKLLA